MPALLRNQIKEIYKLADQGESIKSIAKQLGMHRKTVRKYLGDRLPENKPQPAPLAPGQIDALQRTEARMESMSAHLDDVVNALLAAPQDINNQAAYLPLLHGFCKVLEQHRETHKAYSTSRAHEREGAEDHGNFVKTLLESFDAAELTEEQRRKIHERLGNGPEPADA